MAAARCRGSLPTVAGVRPSVRPACQARGAKAKAAEVDSGHFLVVVVYGPS
jgi:hypothetical protein